MIMNKYSWPQAPIKSSSELVGFSGGVVEPFTIHFVESQTTLKIE